MLVHGGEGQYGLKLLIKYFVAFIDMIVNSKGNFRL